MVCAVFSLLLHVLFPLYAHTLLLPLCVQTLPSFVEVNALTPHGRHEARGAGWYGLSIAKFKFNAHLRFDLFQPGASPFHRVFSSRVFYFGFWFLEIDPRPPQKPNSHTNDMRQQRAPKERERGACVVCIFYILFCGCVSVSMSKIQKTFA